MANGRKCLAPPPKWNTEYYSWDEVPVLIDVKTACILLKMSEENVLGLCKNNTLPARKYGKQWRIDKEKLRQMFDVK